MRYLAYRKEFLQEFINNGGFAGRALRAVVEDTDNLPENTLRARASELLNDPITQKNLKAIIKRRIKSGKRVTMRQLQSVGQVDYAFKEWGLSEMLAIYQRMKRENAKPNF